MSTYPLKMTFGDGDLRVGDFHLASGFRLSGEGKEPRVSLQRSWSGGSMCGSASMPGAGYKHIRKSVYVYVCWGGVGGMGAVRHLP